MRNLLALFAFALLAFAGVGWFREWYQVKTSPADAGHHSVNIDINRTKILSDVEKGIQKLEEKKQQFATGAGSATEDQTVGPPPPPKSVTQQSASAPKSDTP